MPFQLDTRMYGGGGDGGGGRQRSGLGMLGDLMDLQARQENLQGLQEQRGYINEQRQQAMEKVARANKEEQDLRDLLAKNPMATVEEMSRIVGVTRAQKIEEDRLKNYRTKLESTSAALHAVAALPPEHQQQAWYDEQDKLVNSGILSQDEMSEYSPENLALAGQRTLTALQQLTQGTAQQHANVATSQEERLTALQPFEIKKKKAEALQAARAEVVPRLMTARTPEEYAAVYNDIEEEHRSAIPTVADFEKNPTETRRRLETLGLNPEQAAMNADRDASRQDARIFHQQTEARLAQSGTTITNVMLQNAKKAYGDAKERLEERIADASRRGEPYTADQIRRMEIQAEQSYAEELRVPPSPQLADEVKRLSLDELDAEVKTRNSTRYDDQGKALPPKNPMKREELRRRQLVIANRHRKAYGLPPVEKLGPEWRLGPEWGGDQSDTQESPTPTPQPTPRGGGFSLNGPAAGPRNYAMLGELLNPQPPAAPGPRVSGPPAPAPPAPPPMPAPPTAAGPGGAPGPAGPDPRVELARVEAEIRRLTTLAKSPGPRDISALSAQAAPLIAQAERLRAQLRAGR